MISIGIDPSMRSYGWAVYNDSIDPKKRLMASGHEGTLASSVPVARFVHFRALVNKLLCKYDVGVVGIESPAYGGGPFSETHFALMMFSLESVFNHRKDCVLFDPATLKYLVAKGSANKTDIQKYVQLDTMNPDTINNDEADAYCVAKFAYRFMQVKSGILNPDSLSIQEKRVFLERKKKRKTAAGRSLFKKTAHIFRENSRFFQFSKIPHGSIDLPEKAMIDPDLLTWLNDE